MNPMKLWNREFWVDAGERAVKTAAQMVLVVLGIGITAGSQTNHEAQIINVFALDWHTLLGVALGGAFISVLTSVASLGISGSGASLVRQPEAHDSDDGKDASQAL